MNGTLLGFMLSPRFEALAKKPLLAPLGNSALDWLSLLLDFERLRVMASGTARLSAAQYFEGHLWFNPWAWVLVAYCTLMFLSVLLLLVALGHLEADAVALALFGLWHQLGGSDRQHPEGR